MHGMINKGLQSFVTAIYGASRWEEVRELADLKTQSFEAMLSYDDMITEQILDAVEELTGRERPNILEDFGTFIVSEHSSPAVRRLLRLGGENYTEFLYSLEDIHGRLSIVLPDLEVPNLELEELGKDKFRVKYAFSKLGYSAVFLGLLRAMADDYGSFVWIDHKKDVFEGIAQAYFDIEVYSDIGTDERLKETG